MVDCDYFTQFNKLLIIENQRLVLEYKNCDYSLEIKYGNAECRKIQRKNSSHFLKKMPIKAVYGLIEMEINSYLAVVTKASVIGQIYHRKIFQVQKIQFFCLAQTENSVDKSYVAGLSQIFGSKYFYFSDDYDLTNSLQEFITNNYSMKNKKIQFMFNGDWIDKFIQVKAYQWITGFISGFINISFTHINSYSCEIALISRRDKRRQGRRWITRGSDYDGNTANTAETQVVFLVEANGKQEVFSHVQLRGSIPFLWKQYPDMKWSPSVTISLNDKLNNTLLKKNYDCIKKYYNNCTLINLIDKKGSQERLGRYFQQSHKSLNDEAIQLVWFDFHAECKKMKFENLSKLLDFLEKDISNYGYFHFQAEANGSRMAKKNAQKGIFRTNCMDCLDRTNVVQSVIARQILLSWLIILGISNKARIVSAFQRLPDHLEDIFRNQWTKNADVISILYSGTPAMKTDFTATGKRTIKGAAKDLYNGIRRYFLGNFYDARTQDYIDFSLKKLQPKKNPNQKIRHSMFKSLYLMIGLLVAIPFIVNWQINAHLEQENEYRFTIKTGMSIFFILLGFTLMQLSNSLFVAQPVKRT